ncbi:MAG: DUF5615 family PIN-like protein [Opitutaceae bacterium]
MKVLVDECVPAKLSRLLGNHDFSTARDQGWGGLKNGRLLALAEPEFDLFLTCDRNLEYQQNLRGRKIGIVLLSTNRWPTLRNHAALVQAPLDRATLGSFVAVEIPKG